MPASIGSSSSTPSLSTRAFILSPPKSLINRTQAAAITYRGETLPIIPGMTASVDILTGKKSVLDYLLKPILKARQNALRER